MAKHRIAAGKGDGNEITRHRRYRRGRIENADAVVVDRGGIGGEGRDGGCAEGDQKREDAKL